jgi:hypothetical protein
MKTAIGIIICKPDALSCDYAVALQEGTFLVSNAADLLTGDGYILEVGDHIVVRYNPQDQFCRIIPIKEVGEALDLAAAERLDPSRT